jgi:DNA-binding transcriptional regulator YiaG
MTGAELKHLRHDLSEAVGRRLSTADMARICGLSSANGADTIRKWEEGEGPSGPVATLLAIISAGYGNDCDPAIPEFFDRWLENRLS